MLEFVNLPKEIDVVNELETAGNGKGGKKNNTSWNFTNRIDREILLFPTPLVITCFRHGLIQQTKSTLLFLRQRLIFSSNPQIPDNAWYANKVRWMHQA
ncbi:MAG: hypothetical protein WAM14_10985, partial [Candidatus Nitrosopolaris sp.]